MRKMKTGGYLSGLEKYPDLQKTIQNYRDRLKNDQDLLQKFDKTATSQLQATKNMPAAERSAYIADIQKQYAKPSDEQFAAIKADLESNKRIKTTYRYPVDTTSYGPSEGYYRNLSKEIADQQKKIDELTFTGTRTRTVPQYEMTITPPGSGLIGGNPPVTKMVTELPKDARLVQGNYGAQFYQAPMKGANLYQANTNPTYRKVGSKKITEKFTRQAKAGDPEYDKAFAELGRLEQRHKYRNLYSNANKPNLTSQNVYSNLGMGSAPQGGGLPSTLYRQMTNNAMQRPPQAVGAFSKFAQPQTQPQQMNKGGEVKGKGKAVRGFKFSGVK